VAGGLFAEDSQHGGGDGGGMLFFDAAHHHAEVARFDDDAYALGLDDLLDGFGELGGETLLHLQAAGKDLDQAGQFAESDDLAVGDVGDVHLAEKRQHVVLAHAEHFDVFDDHHLIVIDGEERVVDDVGGLLGVAVGEVLHGLDDALRGVDEAFARGILADAEDHFADEVLEGGVAQGGGFVLQ